MLKTFINGIIREKAKITNTFLGERCLRKQNKRENPLITGDAIALNLVWTRDSFGLTLEKYKLHTSPHFQNMPKNYLLT